MGAVFGIAAVGCSSDPEASVPTVELSTTTVTTLPPTTSIETTEAPTTTIDPRIAEVEAAVAGLREAQVRVLLDASVEPSELAEFATGEFLDGLVDNTLKARAEGREFSGEFKSAVVELESVSENEVTVTECGHDEVAVVDSEGAILVPPDEDPVLRLITVRFSTDDDRWLVSGITFLGQERQTCEL